MNKKELIEKYKKLEEGSFDIGALVVCQLILKDLEQLDEPEACHADEAPRYVKNILARLRELPLHDREVWLKSIMGEFEQDFSRAKWREGYEQGKVEGMIEQEKVKIPQVIAEYIEQKKDDDYHLLGAMIEIRSHKNKEIDEWFEFEEDDNMELFARAWLDGYKVEKEPKYTVKFKATNQYLCDDDGIGLHISPSFRSNFRKSDLEKLSLTEVFDSPLFEVEEV